MSASRFIRCARAPFAPVLFVLALLMAVVPASAHVPHCTGYELHPHQDQHIAFSDGGAFDNPLL
jgi:hypothetical protein